MKDNVIRRYEMFVRVRDFGIANAASFQSSAFAGEQFTLISSVINELSGHAVAQASGGGTSRQGTGMRAALREELREDLIAISRTARAIALNNPGFEDKFRLPRNVGDQTLLNTALTFASEAKPFVSEFVKRELPANFLEELDSTVKVFEKTISEQNLAKQTRITATAAIDTAIDQGMDAVRELDSIVKNKFANDPARLSAWESAKHTMRAPRSPAAVEPVEAASEK
jgi:hypothetical protein